MTNARIDQGRQRLLELRRGNGAWGYRARSTEAVEPSTLASLALLATAVEDDRLREARYAAEGSASRLASVQRLDGSLGVTSTLPEPGWATPFAILLWAALGGFEIERSKAVAWLLGLKGKTAQRATDDPMGHDSMIVGWPWVADTHSWVEPTAMALLALAVDGKSRHPRVTEGLRLLVDRAIPSGGWNLGNPVVFKTPLRPLPGPTGLALLALASLGATSPVVDPAIDYLKKALAETLAPISLGWGLLGLRAWNSEPASSQTWVDSAFEQVADREASTEDLALLLLASGGTRSLRLLGVGPRKEGLAHA